MSLQNGRREQCRVFVRGESCSQLAFAVIAPTIEGVGIGDSTAMRVSGGDVFPGEIRSNDGWGGDGFRGGGGGGNAEPTVGGGAPAVEFVLAGDAASVLWACGGLEPFVTARHQGWTGFFASDVIVSQVAVRVISPAVKVILIGDAAGGESTGVNAFPKVVSCHSLRRAMRDGQVADTQLSVVVTAPTVELAVLQNRACEVSACSDVRDEGLATAFTRLQSIQTFAFVTAHSIYAFRHDVAGIRVGFALIDIHTRCAIEVEAWRAITGVVALCRDTGSNTADVCILGARTVERAGGHTVSAAFFEARGTTGARFCCTLCGTAVGRVVATVAVFARCEVSGWVLFSARRSKENKEQCVHDTQASIQHESTPSQ